MILPEASLEVGGVGCRFQGFLLKIHSDPKSLQQQRQNVPDHFNGQDYVPEVSFQLSPAVTDRIGRYSEIRNREVMQDIDSCGLPQPCPVVSTSA